MNDSCPSRTQNATAHWHPGTFSFPHLRPELVPPFKIAVNDVNCHRLIVFPCLAQFDTDQNNCNPLLTSVRMLSLSNDMLTGVEGGCAEISERVGGVRADGARDFAAGGRGEAEEVQRGDAASRKEGAVLLSSVAVSSCFRRPFEARARSASTMHPVPPRTSVNVCT